jgi:hypothetical protein
MKVRMRVLVAIGLLGLIPVALFSQDSAVKPNRVRHKARRSAPGEAHSSR